MIRVKLTLTHHKIGRTTEAWLGLKSGIAHAAPMPTRARKGRFINFKDCRAAQTILDEFKAAFNGEVDAEFVEEPFEDHPEEDAS